MIKLNQSTNIFFRKVSRPVIKKSHFNWRDLNYLNFSWQIALPIFWGLTIGIILDKLGNTRPILFLVFLVFGIISSFYNIVRLLKRE